MYFARSDLRFLEEVAVRHSAVIAGASDRDAPLDQLRREIAERRPVLHEALVGFLSAYEDWLALHEDIEAGGATGNLSSDQSLTLTRIVERKERSRETFLSRLRQPE